MACTDGISEKNFWCVGGDFGFKRLELRFGNLQSTRHHLFRAVPVLFYLEKILTGLLTLFGPLDHADFLCHVDGEHGVLPGLPG